MPRSLQHVAILVLPSVVPFDLGVALQVFGYPRPDLGRRRYRVTICAARPGAVESSSTGLRVVVANGLSALGRADTVLVPGIDDLQRPISGAALKALRAAHARGARMISICTGAFALAEAGLLDGRRATTHWADVAEFARRFPRVMLDPNVLYVDEGTILTSAGVAAGIDLCLHVVRKDHGAAVATAVARRLVVAPHRSGGQAQFIPRSVVEERDSPLDAPLDATRQWARERLRGPLTVVQLARNARMPLRTFARRFFTEVGSSPLRWISRERVLLAQEALELTEASVSQVARRAGFASPLALRVHFRRELGTTPQAYRRTFRGSAGGAGVKVL